MSTVPLVSPRGSAGVSPEIDLGPGTSAQFITFKSWPTPEAESVRAIPSGELSGLVTAMAGPEYWVTVRRVRELLSEPEADEDDTPTRPTEYAFDIVTGLLKTAAQWLPEDFPRGSASVGDDGGVRVTWSGGAKEVRLVCGGSETDRSYLYFESDDGYGIEDNMSADHLASYLRWLVDGSWSGQ